MRTARLFGTAHHVLGAVATVAEDRAAIALSRGGFRKTYAHTDANEDAVCFALGEHGVLVAVADGHFGARGSERALDWLLRERAARWTDAASFPPARWHDTAADALREVHRDLHRQAAELGVDPAPTTLSLALVRPREGRLLHASIGDSHVFLTTREAGEAHEARDLGWATAGDRRCAFVGEHYEDGLDQDHWVIGDEPLGGATAVVLSSDGLSERRIGVADPAAAAAASVDHALSFAAERRCLEACRHVTEAALEAHRANRAGDNMAAAVVWLEEDRPGESGD